MRKSVIFVSSLLLLSFFTIVIANELDARERLTQTEIEAIDFKTENFSAEYSKYRNGSYTLGECSRRTGACYLPLNITVYQEEIIIEEIDSPRGSYVNRTGGFEKVNITLNIKYEEEYITIRANNEGITYAEAFEDYINEKKENMIERDRFRGEKNLKSN